MLQRPILLFFICLLALGVVLAASPTSFCKCMCFKNSTIIALDDPEQTPASTTARLRTRDDKGEFEEGGDEKKAPYRSKNCKDCSKQFCLSHNLPICKDAKEDDVTTTCFQRDSAKDQAVVFIFIFMTSGLLGWALIRPWVDTWVERAKERRWYIPVAND